MRKEIRDALIAESAGNALPQPVFTWDREGRGSTPRIYGGNRLALVIEKATGQPFYALTRITSKGKLELTPNFGDYVPASMDMEAFEVVDRYAETSKADN